MGSGFGFVDTFVCYYIKKTFFFYYYEVILIFPALPLCIFSSKGYVLSLTSCDFLCFHIANEDSNKPFSCWSFRDNAVAAPTLEFVFIVFLFCL